MTIEVERDAEGYLIDPDDWSRDIATKLAQEEGIELSEQHWKILKFMRKYYIEQHVAADVRHVTDYLAAEYEFDKKDAKKQLFQLFPYGYVKQACKISGMKKPRAWSTG